MKYNLNYLRDKTKYNELLSQSLFRNDKLSYSIYKDSIYQIKEGSDCGFVYDKYGNQIINSEALAPNEFNHIQTPLDSKIELKNIEGICVLVSNVPLCYGSVITEGLKSLWFASTDVCKSIIANGGKFVVFYKNDEIPSYLKILFHYLGIDEFLVVSHNTKFESLIVPDLSWTYHNKRIVFYGEFRKMIDDIKCYFLSSYSGDRSIFDKVYFSRTHYSLGDRDMGEYIIEKAFRKKGFYIVYPESMPFERSLWILLHCSEFASTEGSISHNTLFCEDGITLAIIKKSDWINPYQLAINELKNFNVYYIDAHHSIPSQKMKEGPFSGPFYLCNTREFKSFIRNPNFSFPFFFRPSYWWYLLREVPWINRYVGNRVFVHKLYRFIRNYHLRFNKVSI